jgi:REP element-mobilizing transposase RayT
VWHHVYVHVVWTTRDRVARIDAPLAEFLCRFLRDVARQERALILEIGLVATHVHLLARLHPTTRLPRLMRASKAAAR